MQTTYIIPQFLTSSLILDYLCYICICKSTLHFTYRIMKKFWAILAVAALFVACGGNDKKSDKRSEGEKLTTEQTEGTEQTNTLSVEEQLKEYTDRMKNAESNEELMQIVMDMERWMDSLSEEEQSRVDELLLTN